MSNKYVAITLFTISTLAVLTGLSGLTIISLAPIPAVMADFGWLATRLIPASPSILLLFTGWHVVASYRSRISDLGRYCLGSVVAVFTVLVWVSFYHIFTAETQILHTAFNWAFYLLPVGIIAYKVEQIIWLRFG